MEICINSRPLIMIFNQFSDCPKVNFRLFRWQRFNLACLMLITVLYLIWSKGTLWWGWVPNLGRTGNFQIFNWIGNPQYIFQCLLLRSFKCQPKGHWGLCNKVEFLNLAESLVGIEPGTFLFICNALTHWAILSKLVYSRWFDL